MQPSGNKDPGSVQQQSGAHLTGLIRTRVGEVRLEDCMQVEDFPEWLEQQEIEVINE